MELAKKVVTVVNNSNQVEPDDRSRELSENSSGSSTQIPEKPKIIKISLDEIKGTEED